MNSALKFFSKAPWFALHCFAALIVSEGNLFAETAATTITNAPVPSASVPDMGGSVIRVFGALIFVIGIFLAGVWLFRNWQRLAVRKGISPKLHVLEVKSLGQRQAIYVVGYQQQRMLLGSSPAGITLISHLPAAEENEAVAPPATRMSFTDALQQVLNRKP